MKLARRIIALVLVVVFIGVIFYSSTRVVNYTPKNEADKLAAEYLEEKAEYLSESRLQRFGHYYNHLVRSLGNYKTIDDYYNDINLFIGKGEYEKALASIEQCILIWDDINDTDKEILLEKRGYLYVLLDDYDTAIDTFNSLKVKSTDVILLEAQIYLEQQKNAEALILLDEYVQNNPSDTEMIQIYAELLYYCGLYDLAEVQYNSLIDNMEEKQSIYFLMRGLCRQQLGNYEESIEDFVKTIEYDYEDTAFCEYNIAMSYYMMGEDELTVEIGEKAMKADSEQIDYSQLYKYVGQAYLRLKNYDKCIETFTIAVDEGNIAESIYYYRGVSYMVKGEYEKAKDDFSISIDNNEEIDLCYYNSAICKMQLGDYEGAGIDLKKVIEITESEEIVSSAQGMLDAIKE